MEICPELRNLKPVAETIGHSKDFKILILDEWLQESLVQDWIFQIKGQFEIKMVIYSRQFPLNLIVKTFEKYPTEQKAQLFGQILKRTIGRDIRGNLKVNKNAFNICNN